MLEVVEDDAGGTYRAVYTVKFAEAVFVLHCFQKKSKRGIATPKKDMDIIWVPLEIQSSPKCKAREKFRRATYVEYVSKKFFPQRRSWDEIWISRDTHPRQAESGRHARKGVTK